MTPSVRTGSVAAILAGATFMNSAQLPVRLLAVGFGRRGEANTGNQAVKWICQAAGRWHELAARSFRDAMKAAVLVFPGINRERDMARTLRLVSGREPAMIWHTEPELSAGTDLVVIPGGFSYGDYLRCGAIAARSPVMPPTVSVAAKSIPVRVRRKFFRLPTPR